MDRSSVLTLIAIQYTRDSIGQHIPAETRRDVFCNISSISADEFFSAGRQGLHAVFRVSMFAPDYDGEQICELDGKRYGVYRTYYGKNEMIELYLEEKAGVK